MNLVLISHFLIL